MVVKLRVGDVENGKQGEQPREDGWPEEEREAGVERGALKTASREEGGWNRRGDQVR